MGADGGKKKKDQLRNTGLVQKHSLWVSDIPDRNPDSRTCTRVRKISELHFHRLNANSTYYLRIIRKTV